VVAARSLAVANAHRPLLVDAAARVVRREVESLRRAARKPESFAEYTARFYSNGQRDYALQSLTTPVVAMSTAVAAAAGSTPPDPATSAEKLTTSICDGARAEMLAAIEGAAVNLIPERVEAVLARWEAERPQRMADDMLQSLKRP
jgi:hypothetical protein